MARVPKYYEYREKYNFYVVRYKGKYCGVCRTEDEAKELVQRVKDGYVYTAKTPQEVKDDLLRRDPNYYTNIGSIGGKVKVPKGFATNKKLASKAGKMGGAKSRKK